MSLSAPNSSKLQAAALSALLVAAAPMAASAETPNANATNNNSIHYEVSGGIPGLSAADRSLKYRLIEDDRYQTPEWAQETGVNRAGIIQVPVTVEDLEIIARQHADEGKAFLAVGVVVDPKGHTIKGALQEIQDRHVADYAQARASGEIKTQKDHNDRIEAMQNEQHEYRVQHFHGINALLKGVRQDVNDIIMHGILNPSYPDKSDNTHLVPPLAREHGAQIYSIYPVIYEPGMGIRSDLDSQGLDVVNRNMQVGDPIVVINDHQIINFDGGKAGQGDEKLGLAYRLFSDFESGMHTMTAEEFELRSQQHSHNPGSASQIADNGRSSQEELDPG